MSRSQHGRPRLLRQRRQQNPNASLPNHQHRIIRLQLQQPNRLEASIHRLNKRRLLKRNIVRHMNQPRRRHAIAHNPIHHANVLANPPPAASPSPAVVPTFLYVSHCANVFFRQ